MSKTGGTIPQNNPSETTVDPTIQSKPPGGPDGSTRCYLHPKLSKNIFAWSGQKGSYFSVMKCYAEVQYMKIY